MQQEQLAARLLATFQDELDEQLKTLDGDLLALENDSSDQGHLSSVFRVLHTLKGASRAAGVRPIEELCHALETACASARATKSPLTATQLALLFAGADALTDSGRRLRDDGDGATSPALLELLQQLRRQPSPPVRPQAAGAAGRIAAVTNDLVAGDAGSPTHAPGIREVSAPGATAGVGDVSAQGAGHGMQRDEQLRIGVRQVDSLVTAAGELLGMATTFSERPDEVAALAETVRAWRTEWRRTAATSRRSLERAGASPALVTAIVAVDDHIAQLDRSLVQLARNLGDDARSLDGTTARLVEELRRLRMRPFADLAEALPRAVRDVAVSLGKTVVLVIEGQEIEGDRRVLDALREPLLHLVRNAIDHGIESPDARESGGKPATGTLRVVAALRGDRLTVKVSDDGAGLDIGAIRAVLRQRGREVPPEDRNVARALFESGFSTRREATAFSGRGVGLDIVRNAVERLGGTVDVDWVRGKGTVFAIETPVSVATLRTLLVVAGGQTFALPTAFVQRLTRVPRASVRQLEGHSVLVSGESPVPLVSLARLLGPPLVDRQADGDLTVVVLVAGARTLAVAVEDVLEEREIVIRPLDHAGADADAHFSGATLLDGKRVALVVNVASLAVTGARADRGASVSFGPAAVLRRHRVLVVDDSITTRTLEQSVLSAAGFDVVTAVDGADAWRMIEDAAPDLVITDVEMPRMDGLQLCERIRASVGHARLPVILVTSLDKPEQRARGLDAGADAYITKSSFDQDTLLSTVRQLLGDST